MTTEQGAPEESAPEVVETTAAAASCTYCAAPPVLCEAHAAAMVAQAFTEDDANKRDQAARSAERALRRGSSGATRTDDATALRHVLVRWWGDDAKAIAAELLRLLEAE